MAASPDMDTLAQLAGLGVEAVERMAEEDITIELLIEVRRPRTHPTAPAAAAAAAAHALGRRAYAHARQPRRRRHGRHRSMRVTSRWPSCVRACSGQASLPERREILRSIGMTYGNIMSVHRVIHSIFELKPANSVDEAKETAVEADVEPPVGLAAEPAVAAEPAMEPAVEPPVEPPVEPTPRPLARPQIDGVDDIDEIDETINKGDGKGQRDGDVDAIDETSSGGAIDETISSGDGDGQAKSGEGNSVQDGKRAADDDQALPTQPSHGEGTHEATDAMTAAVPIVQGEQPIP